MRLYNPFPAARWLRTSLNYLNDIEDDNFRDELTFIMTECKWRKISFE